MTKFSQTQFIRRAAVAGAVTLFTLGCGRGLDTSDESLALGEATAALTTSEESGEVAGDAVAFASDADVDATAGETADAAGPAPAEAGDVCDFSARRKKVLDTYDENKNGKLEATELAALKADLAANGTARPRFFQLGWRVRSHAFNVVRWAFDEDASRSLSAEERAAMIDALEARCERIRATLIETYDANKDGKLDDTERAAVRDAVKAKLQEKYQALLAKYDANSSGTLELVERQAIRADLIADLKKRRSELVAKYDTDKDGRLSTTEALPLREAIQTWIADGKSE